MVENHLHCQTLLWLIFQIIMALLFYLSTPIFPTLPVERKIDSRCHFCKRKQLTLRLGWATNIHRCQGLTIGEVSRYIVINPGTRAFYFRNPGALFCAVSRAKSTGKNITDPDFAWHPSFLLNEARICHCVNTPTTTERNRDTLRIESIAKKKNSISISSFLRRTKSEKNITYLVKIQQ